MPTWKPPTAPTTPVRQAIADWLRTYLDDSVVSDQRAPARVKRAIMKVPATAVNKVLPLTGWAETPQPLGVADIPSPATIMIGRGSPLFNREMAAKFAEALRKIPVAGRQNPEVVQNLWDRFRTFLSPDNRLRQEISDEGLRVDTGYPNEWERYWRADGDPIMVEHPELKRAYPGLMDALEFRSSHRGEDFGKAFYRRKFPDVRRNPTGEIVLTRPNPEQTDKVRQMPQESVNREHRTSMAHELQHAVQIAEGFAPGTSDLAFSFLPAREREAFIRFLEAEQEAELRKEGITRTFKIRRPTDLNDPVERHLGEAFYLMTPGEAEARLVERRLREPSPAIAPPLQYDLPLSSIYRPRR
jgi:hypothetical protein